MQGQLRHAANLRAVVHAARVLTKAGFLSVAQQVTETMAQTNVRYWPSNADIGVRADNVIGIPWSGWRELNPHLQLGKPPFDPHAHGRIG